MTLTTERPRQIHPSTRADAGARQANDEQPPEGGRGSREKGRLRRVHPIWTNRRRGTWTSVEVVEAGCLVCICGALDTAALQPCRAALDAALEWQPQTVIVDVSHTQAPDPATVPLLSAARRYVRARGAIMTLAGVPEALMQALREAKVNDLYTFEDARWTEDSPIYLRSAGVPIPR